MGMCLGKNLASRRRLREFGRVIKKEVMLERLFHNTNEKIVRHMAEHMCMIVDLELSQDAITRIIESHKRFKISDKEFDLVMNLFVHICRLTKPKEIRTILYPLKESLVWNPGDISLRFLIDYERRRQQKKLDNPGCFEKLARAFMSIWVHPQVPENDNRDSDSLCSVPSFKSSGNVLRDLFEESGMAEADEQLYKSIFAEHSNTSERTEEKSLLIERHILNPKTTYIELGMTAEDVVETCSKKSPTHHLNIPRSIVNEQSVQVSKLGLSSAKCCGIADS